MIPCRDNALLLMLRLLEKIGTHPARPQPCKAGRKRKYSDMLFLKAAVIMSVKRFSHVYELLTTINEPTPEMAVVNIPCPEGRGLFIGADNFPDRSVPYISGSLLTLIFDIPTNH